MESEFLLEEWRPVVGYEGLYEVSSFGRIKRLEHMILLKNGHRKIKEIIMSPSNNSRGYQHVNLSKNKIKQTNLLHRLVAEAFIPNPDNLPCINHKDENKLNNFVFVNPDGSVDLEKSNLEWCTYQYNNTYGNRLKKSTNKRSKPVLQYTLDGEFVREWPSASEAGRNGYKQQAIVKCCNNTLKKHHGYIFKYK